MCAFNDVPRRRGSLTGGGRNNNHNNNNNNNENENVTACRGTSATTPLGRATGHSPPPSSVVVGDGDGGGVCRATEARRPPAETSSPYRGRRSNGACTSVRCPSSDSSVHQLSRWPVVCPGVCAVFFSLLFLYLSYLLHRRLCSFRGRLQYNFLPVNRKN